MTTRTDQPKTKLTKLYTKKEVAKFLRCCPRSVDTLIARGELECLRIGTRQRKTVRISQDQLEKYMSRLHGDAAREAMNN